MLSNLIQFFGRVRVGGGTVYIVEDSRDHIIEQSKLDYKDNLRPDFEHKTPVLTPFKDAYTLFAQTRSEEYGRTRQYLIIGCVVYQ